MLLRTLAVFACASLGCTTANILPPRTTPAAVMPPVTLPAQAPPAGTARVVLDATDGPMNVVAQRIEAFAGTNSSGSTGGPLCRTPCSTVLPYGRYDLYYSGLASDPSRGDHAELEVREGVNVLLRAPGKYEPSPSFQPGPITLFILAGLGTSIGTAMLATPGGDRPAGGAVLGVGVISLVAGLVLYEYRADQQDGASTFFRQPVATTPTPSSVPESSP